MALKNTKSQDKFVSILADGTMRVVVPEGTEGAVKRSYETSDGKTGSKHELVYTELTGMITKIKFFEGDYGKLIQLTVLDEEDEEVVLSISTAQPFGEDVMKKLPNIDLKESVKIVPYSFKDEKTGKLKKGVTIYQDEKKMQNYFYDHKKKANINGYPDPKFKKKTPTKDDWKLYFLNARVFLIDFITDFFEITDEPKEEKKPSKKSSKKESDSEDTEDDEDEDKDW